MSSSILLFSPIQPSKITGPCCATCRNLEGNRLEGPLPPEWGALKGLSSINLDGNSFTGSVPDSWESMKDILNDIVFVKPPPPAISPSPDNAVPPPPPFWVPSPPGTSVTDVDGLGNAPPPPPPSEGMPVWQIAVIVALGLLALAAIAALILMLVCCLCKKKKDVADNPHPKSEQVAAATALKASGEASSAVLLLFPTLCLW
mmetsp:Transcript_6100/g.16994  ORF Transcript_6100/g.16994 Transcript_6100/m.16994 type:complete len:202 (-) Transcript_6100:621-1226(-)